MLKKLFGITLATIMILSIFAFASPVYAQTAPGFSVKNDIIIVQLQPGQSYTHKLIVLNESSDTPLDMQAEIDGLGQGNDGALYELLPTMDSNPYSARTFITNIDKTVFHLEPNATLDINTTVRVPAGTLPGERYACIYIYTNPLGQDKIGIRLAAIIPVIIIIPGFTPQRTATINMVDAEDTPFGDPVSISTIVRNNGNCRLDKITNKITILDSFGGQVWTNQISMLSPSLMPGYSRAFTTHYNGLSKGTYSVKSDISLDNGLLLNTQTASFQVTNITPTPTDVPAPAPSTTPTPTPTNSPNSSSVPTATPVPSPSPGSAPDAPSTVRTPDIVLPSGIDTATVSVIKFEKQDTPVFAEAIRKTDMEATLMGLRSGGTLVLAKYAGRPANLSVPFESGIIKNGTGKTGLKFAYVMVLDTKQGTANINLHYTNDEIKDYDKSSLSLYYYFGDKWIKCANIVNSPETNSISGDIPIVRLAGTILALGGDLSASNSWASGNTGTLGNLDGGQHPVSFSGTNSSNENGIGWVIVGIVIVSIVMLGIAGLYLISRSRRVNGNAE